MAEITKIVCNSNEEWRHERCHSIGASAVPILLGENYFVTPMELCHKMRAELNGEFDYEQTLAMMRGHAYEQGVADLFQWSTGHEVIKASSAEYLLRRNDIPFMHASPDRTYWIDPEGFKHGKRSEANKGILECKTTRRHVDPDDPPLAWVVQLQVQLGISGYTEGYLAWDVLTEADGFGFQKYVFDKEAFSAVVELCRDFWYRCVIGGDEPEPVNARDIMSLYPTHIEGKTVTCTAAIADNLAMYREMRSAKKDLEGELEGVGDAIKAEFTDAEAIVDLEGHVLATYRANAKGIRMLNIR